MCEIMSNKHDGTRKNETISIHSCIKFTLKLLKVLGFFPVSGITNPNIENLKFEWFSLAFLGSTFWFFGVLFLSCVEIHKMFFQESSLGQATTVAFYVSGLLCHVLFLKLAKDWPQLMLEWHKTEMDMGNRAIRTNLKTKMNALNLVFMFVATVEHILIQVHLHIEILKHCWSVEDRIRQTYIHMYCYTFTFIFDYALWKAILLHSITLRSTFSWSYIDVFIMLISTALALRVKQLATKVEILLKNKSSGSSSWKKIRQEYHQLCKLSSVLNTRMSYIIFLSYGSNLYFILVQLFGSMKPLKSTLRKVYYYLSFFLLIARVVGVTLYGASVNDESRKILPLLLSMPTSSYNKEVERLIEQVITKHPVISTQNFFQVTKGLLVKFTGALVTYELVLIQFNSLSFSSDETVQADRCWSNSSNTSYSSE